MADYDIIVTRGTKRQNGLFGSVRKPTMFGVEADLENGERVSLRNRDFDYVSEHTEERGWSQEYGFVWDAEKLKNKFTS